MLATLHRHDFAWLWAGQTVSLVGNWLLLVALPFYVYDLTGSALATGATFAAAALPSLLLGPVAGVFVDRWDRRRTMLVVDLARATVLLLLLAVRSAEWLWLVYLVTGIQTAFGQFFGPARNALVPRTLPAEQLDTANSLDALSVQATGLVGPALGGALMAAFGWPSVVVLDSATFLISAAAISLVRQPVPPEVDPVAPRISAPGRGRSFASRVWHELRDGLRLIRDDRAVRAVACVVILAWLGQGIINALFVPFIKDALHGNAQQYAWTVTAQGVGGVLGGLLIGRLGHLEFPGRLMGIGGLGCGLLFLGIVNVSVLLVRADRPWLPVACALFAVAGALVMALFVPHLTVLQQSVADAFRGRVFGTVGAATTLAMVVGLGTGGVLEHGVGSVLLLDLSGALYAVAGLVAFRLIPRHGRRASRTATDRATKPGAEPTYGMKP